jgi:hypothetical protein
LYFYAFILPSGFTFNHEKHEMHEKKNNHQAQRKEKESSNQNLRVLCVLGG